MRPARWRCVEIDLGGLGLAKAEVSRHLPAENRPGATASPTAP
ncbi:hypothetical protein ABZ370_39315 [Streptomyces sp. NPDC005962]